MELANRRKLASSHRPPCPNGVMRHKSGFQPEITPGMPLSVDILGYEATAMNYIVTHIKKFIEISVLGTLSLG